MPLTNKVYRTLRDAGYTDYDIIQHIRQKRIDVNRMYDSWIDQRMPASEMIQKLIEYDIKKIEPSEPASLIFSTPAGDILREKLPEPPAELLKPKFTPKELIPTPEEDAWQRYLREREAKAGRARTAVSQAERGLIAGLFAKPLQAIGVVSWHLTPNYYKRYGVKSPTETGTYRAGSWFERVAEEMYPVNPKYREEFLTSTLPQAAGSMTAFMLGGAVGGAGLVGKAAQVGKYAIGGALGAMQTSADEYQQAIKRGADEDTAFKVFLLNLPIGATEILPIGRTMTRLDKLSGGAGKKLIRRLALTAFKGGMEEFLQEFGQQTASNMTAKAVYDESRRIFDGALESGAAGFALGFLLGGLGGGVETQLETATGDDAALLQQAQENIEKTKAFNDYATGEAAAAMTSQHVANMRDMFVHINEEVFGEALNNPTPGIKKAKHLDKSTTPDAIDRIARMNLAIQVASATNPEAITEATEMMQKSARREEIDIAQYSPEARSIYRAAWTMPMGELASRYGKAAGAKAWLSELLLSTSLHGNQQARLRTKNFLMRKMRGRLLPYINKAAEFDIYYNNASARPDIVKSVAYQIGDAVTNPDAYKQLQDVWQLQGGEQYATRMLKTAETYLTKRIADLEGRETRTRAQEAELTLARTNLNNIRQAIETPPVAEPEVREPEAPTPPTEEKAVIPTEEIAAIPAEERAVIPEQAERARLEKAREEAETREAFVEKEARITPEETKIKFTEEERIAQRRRKAEDQRIAEQQARKRPRQEIPIIGLGALTEEQIKRREAETIVKMQQEATARRIAQELAKEQEPVMMGTKAAIIDGKTYPIYELKGPEGSEYYIKTPKSKHWYPITDKVKGKIANRIVIEDISFAEEPTSPPEEPTPPVEGQPPPAEEVAPPEAPAEEVTPTEAPEPTPEEAPAPAEEVTPKEVVTTSKEWDKWAKAPVPTEKVTPEEPRGEEVAPLPETVDGYTIESTRAGFEVTPPDGKTFVQKFPTREDAIEAIQNDKARTERLLSALTKETPPEASEEAPEIPTGEVVTTPEALLTNVTQEEQTPQGIAKVAVDDLALAPERFQYKIGHGKAGVTGTLRGAQQYREELAGVINVWRDPSDGKTYVVNGHNRVELAKRSGVPEVTVKYLDAATAEEARTWGALINIAEGRGSALDAAKLFRDTGISKEDLIQYGIALTEKNAREGLALAALNPTLFNATVRGEFPLSHAIAIGTELPDHALQLDLVRLIEKETKKGKRINTETIRELANMARGAPAETTTEMTLFGEETLKQTYTLEKAELQSYIRQRLSKEKRLFGVVSKSANAQELAKAGNVIDVQASEDVSNEAAQLLSIFDVIKKSKGEINDIINAAAERIGKGGNANAIKQETYETIREKLPEIITRGEAPAVSATAPSLAQQLEVEMPTEVVTKPEVTEAQQVAEASEEEFQKVLDNNPKVAKLNDLLQSGSYITEKTAYRDTPNPYENIEGDEIKRLLSSKTDKDITVHKDGSFTIKDAHAKIIPTKTDAEQVTERVEREFVDAVPDQDAEPTDAELRKIEAAQTKAEIMQAVKRLPKTGQAFWTPRGKKRTTVAKIVKNRKGTYSLVYKGKVLAKGPKPGDLVIESDMLINKHNNKLEQVPDSSDAYALMMRYRTVRNKSDYRSLDEEYNTIEPSLSDKDRKLLDQAIYDAAEVFDEETYPTGDEDADEYIGRKFWRDERGFLRFRRDRIPDDLFTVISGNLMNEQGDVNIPDDVPKEVSQRWLDIRKAPLADEELLKQITGGEDGLGAEIIEAMRNVRNESQINRAGRDAAIRKVVQPLSKLERVTGTRPAPPNAEKIIEAVMVIEGADIPLDEQQQAFVDEWRRIAKEDAEYATEQGLTVRTPRRLRSGRMTYSYEPFEQAKIENYWPHIRNYDSKEAWDAFVKEQYEYDIEDIADEIAKVEGIPMEEATQKAMSEWKLKDTDRDLRMRRSFAGGRPMRNLEYRRVSRKPGYKRDASVALQYIEDIEWRKAEIKHFGKRDEIIDAKIEEIGKRYGDNAKAYAQEVFDRFTGKEQGKENRWWYDINRTMGTWNVLSYMGLSTINQLAQWWNVPMRVGLRNTIAGTFGPKGIFTRSGRRFAREAAATIPYGLEVGLLETRLGKGFLSLNGFLQMDRAWRAVAAISGAKDAEQYANNLINGKNVATSRRMLIELGLDADAIVQRGYITDFEQKMAGKRVADETQFSGASYEVPAWMKEQKYKFLFMNLRQFAYMQSRFIGKVMTRMIREARQGNFTPLRRFFTGIVGMTVAGELIRAIKAKIYGTWDEKKWTTEAIEEGDWETALTNVAENIAQASTFGIALDMFWTLAKWGTMGFVASLPGPELGQMIDITAGTTEDLLIKRDPRKTLRRTAGNVPFGTIWRQWLKKKKKKGYNLRL